MKVSPFAACLGDALFPGVNEAVARLPGPVRHRAGAGRRADVLRPARLQCPIFPEAKRAAATLFNAPHFFMQKRKPGRDVE